ncbi:hypothetical protein A2690_01840 [Candidatus Roizmanbacteria bacterium RIFCSPHIGHO2_01_FULL_39_12b]|uniref:Glycosyltransferase RgtA/B/C/D-like domain-containing protein n=1 Tax=Candidatus Roizmanbacteria bacterium RIFCSPHIGHO2_01_FULL_39_12b TaxID=1802030 RepID=A0A1F7GB73_9BACT|nr:MAG: hypothetical protein A2690_01840 [Candidatus Roizmanbacteria bacterium RIFCSPHIGHO2_01_FULL_39_12b]OGK46163.1 MAG: hypothetical protein A3B46_03085 [Candidatus Roizmanbacteria bacterium RIFCSPLOWO2_01_FULL_39_19]
MFYVKFFTNHRNIIALFVIFLIALFLRVYNLDKLPINLHEDEILSGYVGHFILRNGIDVYGNKWPLLYFNKFGDYYIILPFYLSGLGVVLFGPNGLGVRFFGAFLGALAVFPVYFLSKLTFKNAVAGLCSAFVIAIMPWHIVLSRTTVEGLMGSTVFAFGLVLLLFFKTKNNYKYLFLSLIIFLFSYFFYHPFRIYTPAVFLIYLLIYFKKNNKTKIALPTLMCLLFTGLTLFIGLTAWGKGRFIQTSIFSPLSGVSIRIQEAIFNEKSVVIARIFSNKILGYSREFIYQYSRYFSPDVLFVRGGNSPHFFVPEQGLLYVIFLPLLLLGLYHILKKDKGKLDKKNLMMVFFLLFLAPIPAGLTIIDSPNIHRSVFMTIPLSILIGYGLFQLALIPKYKKIILLAVMSILIGELVFFWHQYSVQSDRATSLVRNDGQKEIVKYVEKHRKAYNKVYLPIDRTFPLYYLFYTNNFNKEFAKRIKFNIQLENINNVFFVKSECSSSSNIDMGLPRILVIDRHNCKIPNGLRQIDSIVGANLLTPFKIYTN